MPVSDTESSAPRSERETEIVTRPPGRLYLMALSHRLLIISSKSWRTPEIRTGPPVTSRVTCPLTAAGVRRPATSWGQVVQVHLLRLEGAAPFIQLGQAEDVLHQADHALGLAVDVVCEAGDVLRLDQARP